MDIQEPNLWQRNRVTLSAISVVILIVVLASTGRIYPGSYHGGESRQAEVQEKVSSKWAGLQILPGPSLAITSIIAGK